MTTSQYLYRTFLSPRSQQPDARRQEFIFNIIVLALLAAALLASTVVTINHFSQSIDHFGDTFITTWVFTIGLIGLLRLSRSGRARLAIITFMALITILTIQLALQWGFMLPIALLLAVMVVVIAGVLLGARSGLWFAMGAGIFWLVISYLQQQNVIYDDERWLAADFHVGDAVGYVVIIVIIGVVSWLSNREIDRSLQRARASEKALAAERDSLESKVIVRTRELEETQLIRLLELQRFATFGHLSANLLHEIANPLTAVSLNLELMDPAQSALVTQARKNLKHLERYVKAARQQLLGSSEISNFSINAEVRQILNLLMTRAKQAHVLIEYQPVATYKLYGDSVKFSQSLANLLANAIDAYATVDSLQKVVSLQVKKSDNNLVITVHDNGSGLSKELQARIFEPFFTTKRANGRGLGIGLAMVQQFIEQDFGGQITVTSSKLAGTTFQITLPHRRG